MLSLFSCDDLCALYYQEYILIMAFRQPSLIPSLKVRSNQTESLWNDDSQTNNLHIHGNTNKYSLLITEILGHTYQRNTKCDYDRIVGSNRLLFIGGEFCLLILLPQSLGQLSWVSFTHLRKQSLFSNSEHIRSNLKLLLDNSSKSFRALLL